MNATIQNGVKVVPYGTDNLAYLVVEGGTCLVIDPGAADEVLCALERHGLRPERLLATHGHTDHTAGAANIARRMHCPPLVFPRRPPTEEIEWSGGRLSVLPVPGHTRDDVAYLDPERNALFSGDTLFTGGCGRLFECDAGTMWRSLTRLAALPKALRVFSGHNYTADNLAFASHLVPDDPAVSRRLEKARAGDALVPSSIGEEARTNPFLRCANPAFRTRLGLEGWTAAECFAELRRRKDRW